MKDKKVKTVKKQKPPTKIKEVESFLEFTNFYQYFIKNFIYIAKSLNKLKDKKEWKQKEEHQKSFNQKTRSLVNQYLLYLEEKENTEQKTEYVIEEVLSQKQEGK